MWNIFGAHRLSYCCVLFQFSILSLGCACVGCTAHVCTHQGKWVCKLLHPCWPTLVWIWGLPNRKRIILLHPHQSSKFPWCVPHHRAGVAHSAHFNASNCYCSGTALSNSLRNSSTSINSSYVGSSLASVVTQCSDLIIMLQFSVVTSCNWFCHRFTSSSEFEV